MESPVASTLVELGAVILGLAILSRLAARFSIPAIPLYLLAGLAFGKGGVLPLITTDSFIRTGAEIGLILLLFTLGLEYGARELIATLRSSSRAGAADVLLNFTPGFVAGLVLGWSPLASAALGGITLVSSSSIAARLLSEFGWTARSESGRVLSILILEDLQMAVFLPILAALSASESPTLGILAALGALAVVILLLFAAARFELGISRLMFGHSDEALLLSMLGAALLVAGAGEAVHVSAAVAALLFGIALSGPAVNRAHALLAPLRDLFAALFFAFIGLGIDPAALPPVLLPATLLALATAATKIVTGWWAAADAHRRARIWVGLMLVPRAEFSIAIAGLAAVGGLEPRLAPLAVAYVLVVAVGGPLAIRIVHGRLDPAGP